MFFKFRFFSPYISTFLTGQFSIWIFLFIFYFFLNLSSGLVARIKYHDQKELGKEWSSAYNSQVILHYWRKLAKKLNPGNWSYLHRIVMFTGLLFMNFLPKTTCPGLSQCCSFLVFWVGTFTINTFTEAPIVCVCIDYELMAYLGYHRLNYLGKKQFPLVDFHFSESSLPPSVETVDLSTVSDRNSF